MQNLLNKTISQLRNHTRDLHRQLDQSPRIRKMLSANFSIADYRASMLCFYYVYQAIEPKVLAFEAQITAEPSGLLWPAYRSRLPALLQEIQALDDESLDPNVKLIPYEIDSLAAYFGARYVLDGSCHGAKWLLPRLEKYLNPLVMSDLEYWKLLANIHPDWPPLCLAIDVYNNEQDSQDNLIASAKATFQFFIQQVQQQGEAA